MPALSGIIEAVSIKPLNQPDRFGNTFRASLKVGEDWISWGGVKKEAINVKDGGDWVQLSKGMQVEFMYDQNGSFKNIKKASLSITDKSNAQSPAQDINHKPSKPQQQSSGGSFVNPAEVGQCLNLAAEVLKLSKDDLVNPTKVKEAIAWYKQVRETFSELYPSVEAGSKPKPKAKAAPVEDKPPFDEDLDMNYDDDLPI